MEIPVIGEVVRETKTKPYTMMILVGLAIAVPYIWDHAAWAEDLRSVQTQLAQLSYDTKRGNLEQRLQSVETELFSIQQKIADRIKAKQPVDEINYNRVYALQIEKGQLERQLALLK